MVPGLEVVIEFDDFELVPVRVTPGGDYTESLSADSGSCYVFDRVAFRVSRVA